MGTTYVRASELLAWDLEHLSRRKKKKMSCCGGNCGCGSGCKCGSGCGGCKMYPEFAFSGETTTTTQSFIVGVAPHQGYSAEVSETTGASENGGCKCGSSSGCDSCPCK